MYVPALRKATSADVQLAPMWGMDGRVVAVVTIKECFSLGPQAPVRVGGAEVRFADELLDPESPGASSVKLPSDVCLYKPATDVVLIGSAMAPGRARVSQLDVRVSVGSMHRSLRVYGRRYFEASAMGRLRMTDPEPFEAVPLTWENAYGGVDDADPDEPRLEEPRNPVGRGVARHASSLDGALAPQIDDPEHPVGHRSPVPAGVAPLLPGWEPRRSYTGTADEAWQEERMPLLPLDFDFRFFQCAPPGLIADGYLRGGEPVELVNVHPAGPLRFELPKVRFFVGGKTEQGLSHERTALDAVIFRPDDGLMEMVWRSAVPLPRPTSRLLHIQVHEQRML